MPTTDQRQNSNAFPAFGAEHGSASGRMLYVYTFLTDGQWRVYEALMLHALGDEMLMVVVDDFSALHIIKECHISKRNSAHFFVYDNELHLMVADVEADWAKRQLWREAYNDAQRLRSRMPNAPGERPEKQI